MKLLTILGLLLTGTTLYAQQPTTNLPSGREKMIEVSGSAEIELAPDEIYLSVGLREYMKDRNKVRMDEIDAHFWDVVNALKIDKKDISIEGASGYYDWDYWRHRQGEFLASKTYIIKLSDMTKYNQLMQKLDDKGINHVYMQRTDHSKMEEYRQKVKIQALKAAKEKARLMLESIGEQLGEVLYIKETANDYHYPMYKNMMANMAMDGNAEAAAPSADVQKIKLRFEVMATFRIK